MNLIGFDCLRIKGDMKEDDNQYWNSVIKSADLLLSLLAPYETREDMDLVQNILPPLQQLVTKGSSYPISKEATSTPPKQEHHQTSKRYRVSFEQESNWNMKSESHIEITLSSGRVVNCIVVNTPEGLDRAVEAIKQAEYATFDCEFMGSKKALPELKLLQIAVSDICGYAIQVDILGRPVLEQKLKPVLESKEIIWIGWALRSDMLSIEQFFGQIEATGILDLQRKLATYAVEELNLHAAMVKYASDWDGFQEFQRAKQYGDTFWFSDDECIWRLNPLPPRAIVYSIFDVLSVHILHKKTQHMESKKEFHFPESVTHNLSTKALTRWHNQRNKAATQMFVTSPPQNTTKRFSSHRKDKKNSFSLPVPVSPEPETEDGYNDNDPRFTLDVQKAIDLSLREQSKNRHITEYRYDEESGDCIVISEYDDNTKPIRMAEDDRTDREEEKVTQTWGHKKFESPFLGDHLKPKQERFSRPRGSPIPSSTADREIKWSSLTGTQENNWVTEKENTHRVTTYSANPSWHALTDNASPKKSSNLDESTSRKANGSSASLDPSFEKSDYQRRPSFEDSSASRWSKPSSSQSVDTTRSSAQSSNWKSASHWKSSTERSDWRNNHNSLSDETKPAGTANKPIPGSEQPSKQESVAPSSWQSLAHHNRLSPAHHELTSPRRKPVTITSPKPSNSITDTHTIHTNHNHSSAHTTPNVSNNSWNNTTSARSSPIISNNSTRSKKEEDQQTRTTILHGQTGAFTWFDDSNSKEMGPASWASFATSSSEKWGRGIDTQVEELEKAPKVSNPNTTKQFNINVNPYDSNMNSGEKDSWNVQEVQPDTMKMRMNQIPIRKVFTGPRVMNPDDSLSDESDDEAAYVQKTKPKKGKASRNNKQTMEDDDDDEDSMVGLKIKNFEKFEQHKPKEHTTMNLPTFVDSICISPKFNTEEINVHCIMEGIHLNSIEIPTEDFTVVVCYHFAESKSSHNALKAIQLFIKSSDDPVCDSYTVVLEKACFKDRSLKNTKFGRLLTDPSVRRVCWCPEIIEDQTQHKLGFCLGPTIDLNVKVNFDENRPVLTFAQSIDSYMKDWPDLYLLHEAKAEYDSIVGSRKFSGTLWDNQRIKEGVLRYSALQGFGAYALHRATENLEIFEEDCLWESTKYAFK
ncbi:hypothetical protein BD560DRAFT_421371 [Blakeslea trispora]|nr:hypothetical protein BD560DRAFT_421371 [Blakeslea trispora]